jgi:thiamine pyrophosphokinase
VLGNGTWGRADIIQNLAKQADFVVAANGGWAKATAMGIPIDLVIGDLDSLNVKEHKELEKVKTKVVRYPQEKDETDFEIALKHALSLNPKRVILWGITGERLDHSLANIFLLEKAARKDVGIEIVTETEHAYLVAKRLDLHGVKPGDTVSLLPISSQASEIRTQGLKYPLNGETLNRASSRGISNEAISPHVSIELARGVLLVAHQQSRQRVEGNCETHPN